MAIFDNYPKYPINQFMVVAQLQGHFGFQEVFFSKFSSI